MGHRENLSQEFARIVEEHISRGCTHLDVIQGMSEVTMEMLCSLLDLRPLSPQVETTRNLLLRRLDDTRAEMPQAPVVDLLALLGALKIVANSHRREAIS
jgi:hypothetical protein